jgi:K+-sensing histidine kinase KdpD
MRWIQQNTFAPRWLPEYLRSSFIGYLVAVLVELAAIGLILFLLSLLPDFDYFAIFTLVGVVIIALGWGMGPGLLAVLVSTLLLDLVVGTPPFSLAISGLADGIGLVFYMVVGASISLLAGRSEWARRQAVETTHLLTQAEARSRFRRTLAYGADVPPRRC